jgi:mono/diheme cytochrome c family protein
MMARLLRWLVVLGLTRPDRIAAAELSGLAGDAARGEIVFAAAGCTGCHAAPGAESEARLVLSGGQRFASPFGTFVAPNISPDPQAGIGGWTFPDFANAVMRGVSPEGQHYFPAFPWTTYNKAAPQEIADLFAYMQTLPASPDVAPAHEVPFPFNIRRSLGGWKFLFEDRDWVLAEVPTPELERGRYLVEALGHCGECHTPRNALGGLDRSRWLGGAPNPSGQGRIPNITPGALQWSAADIA